jgi:hypothetical protein
VALMRCLLVLSGALPSSCPAGTSYGVALMRCLHCLDIVYFAYSVPVSAAMSVAVSIAVSVTGFVAVSVTVSVTMSVTISVAVSFPVSLAVLSDTFPFLTGWFDAGLLAGRFFAD